MKNKYSIFKQAIIVFLSSIVIISLPRLLQAKDKNLSIFQQENIEEKNKVSNTRNQFHKQFYSESKGLDIDRIQLNILVEKLGNLMEEDQIFDDGILGDIYVFKAKSEMDILIRVDSDEFTPKLILINPENQVIGVNNNANARNNTSEIRITLPEDGEYQIVVKGNDTNSRGNYNLIAIEATENQIQQLEADILFEEGFIEYQNNQIQKASQFWQEALSKYQLIEDKQGEANSLLNLGLVYDLLGEYEKAISFYSSSLKISRKIEDKITEGNALGNLGLVYYSLGEYHKAIDFYFQSLQIKKDFDNLEGEANSLGNLGLAYKALGKYALAIDYFKQSLTIAKQLQDRHLQANSFLNLGLIYNILGESSIAQNYFENSLQISREIGDKFAEANALDNLGIVYNNYKKYYTAIQYHSLSLEIAKTIKHKIGEINSLGNLGRVYHNLKQYDKAIEYFQITLNKAKKIGNKEEEINALENLGLAYESLEKQQQAIEYYQETLEIAQQIGDKFNQGIALNNLGRIYYKQSKYKKAEKLLIKGIETRESLRINLGDREKIAIFETQKNSYPLLQQTLIAQNKIDTAIEISERGRARAFVELIAQHFDKQIDIKPPNISEIKQVAIKEKATLVEYSFVADAIYIWVVSPTGKINFVKQEIEEKEIKELVVKSRREITTLKVNNSKENQLQKLHEILIKPIEKYLPKNPQDKVIFIPQNELFLVPFVALQDSSQKYLIEKHTILTATAIQALQLSEEIVDNRRLNSTSSKDKILVVGNPEMPTIMSPIGIQEKLPSLPGAYQEALSISQILNTIPITGREATETFIKEEMEKSRIIHLATHGLLDDFGTGIPGAIALTPTQSDNGFLTTQEIFNLNLEAELVVLSACNTGRGKITGDGIVGISRSFRAAGASSLIVSLWDIPDNETKFLMNEFYAMMDQDLDKASLLRQAQLKTKEKYPQPIYWASFTIFGET